MATTVTSTAQTPPRNTGDRRIVGQNSFAASALHKVVTAIAADELRVAPRDVGVRLTDDRGLLAVTVTAPVRLAPLGAGAVGAPSRGLLALCQSARGGIQSRTADLTGSEVRTVAIRLTRASILAESRVS